MSQLLSDIFSKFHDGGLISYQKKGETYEFKINCHYLAQLINKNFENFYLIINELDSFVFTNWEEEEFIGLDSVFTTELEIGYAELDNEEVKISCNYYDDKWGDIGGFLRLKANFVQLLDHDKINISTENLFEISDRYWSEKKQGTKK